MTKDDETEEDVEDSDRMTMEGNLIRLAESIFEEEEKLESNDIQTRGKRKPNLKRLANKYEHTD